MKVVKIILKILYFVIFTIIMTYFFNFWKGFILNFGWFSASPSKDCFCRGFPFGYLCFCDGFGEFGLGFYSTNSYAACFDLLFWLLIAFLFYYLVKIIIVNQRTKNKNDFTKSK